MAQQREIVDVFLYQHGANKEWVRTLGEQIESQTFDGTSSGRPMRVFFEEWNTDVCQNVPHRLDLALTASCSVAVIISPEILAAPWPTFEWTHLVADDPTNRNERIIPSFLRDYSFATEDYAEPHSRH